MTMDFDPNDAHSFELKLLVEATDAALKVLIDEGKCPVCGSISVASVVIARAIETMNSGGHSVTPAVFMVEVLPQVIALLASEQIPKIGHEKVGHGKPRTGPDGRKLN